MLQTDARADDQRRSQHAFQVCAGVVVIVRIVARQKSSAGEESPFCQLAPPKDHSRIRRVAELRPSLTEVRGARVHVRQCLRWSLHIASQHELLAALECIAAARLVDQAPGLRE